jgi:hypothetical protein
VAKKNRSPRDLLAAKRDQLNWSLFHFLENLLVFCAMGTRAVPAESGVQFQISSRINTDGICLLFKIDRRGDPLMPELSVKPDYLAIHITSERCLCTIIEMKGRDEKNLKHGLGQIKALRDRLREEARKHLPTACKIKYQGILLAPYNAQLPLPELKKEAKAGFAILPILYNNKAELYPYVRRENAITDRYQHQSLPREKGEFNHIEELLTRCALPVRISGGFDTDRGSHRRGERSGIYLYYARSAGPAGDYAVLATGNHAAMIAAPEPARGFLDWIRSELGRLELGWASRIQFATFPAVTS